eukprot:1093668-Rhodomonas_salina.2
MIHSQGTSAVAASATRISNASSNRDLTHRDTGHRIAMIYHSWSENYLHARCPGTADEKRKDQRSKEEGGARGGGESERGERGRPSLVCRSGAEQGASELRWSERDGGEVQVGRFIKVECVLEEAGERRKNKC